MATIKIKQVRSKIGCPKNQKATLAALGLKKLNSVVEHEDNASIRGMIEAVKGPFTVMYLYKSLTRSRLCRRSVSVQWTKIRLIPGLSPLRS